MTARFCTELQIVRELGLPSPVGLIMLETWKMFPSFPKPVEGSGGRYFWPAVEQWLMTLYGVGFTDVPAASISLSGSKGETFDEWEQSLKAKRSKRSKRSGPSLSLPPQPVGNVVVSTVGPDETGIPSQGGKVVAWRPRSTPAE